jgi:hypothetical protein
VPIDQFSDNLWYYARGVGLAAGRGYSEREIATAYWPLGWPGCLGLLFWLFGPTPLVGQVANLVLAALIFFLVVGLASAVFDDHLVERLAAARLKLLVVRA